MENVPSSCSMMSMSKSVPLSVRMRQVIFPTPAWAASTVMMVSFPTLTVRSLPSDKRRRDYLTVYRLIITVIIIGENNIFYKD